MAPDSPNRRSPVLAAELTLMTCPPQMCDHTVLTAQMPRKIATQRFVLSGEHQVLKRRESENGRVRG
jgi:hypothetical protein